MKYYYLLGVLLVAGILADGFMDDGWVWAESPPATRADYLELEWEKLVPPGWNPNVAFEGLDLDKLDDNDPRAEAALEKFRKLWDNAPANPEFQGKPVKISGFVAPLDFTDRAELREFLLVPYFGACIHAPPPPANQIVLVVLKNPRKGIRSMDKVSVYGRLLIKKTETDMGRAGYSLRADELERYVEKSSQ